MATITSANSTFHLAIPSIFPVPQRLEGYAVDDAFTTDSVESAEVQMGVDGKLSAGFTPFVVKMTIAFQADSPSIDLFDTWLNAMRSSKEVFRADGSIYLPAVKRLYTALNGYLTGGKVMPDSKKLLQPVQYNISWEAILPAATV